MAVLLELLHRNKIEYTEIQVEKICKNFWEERNGENILVDKSEYELEELLFSLLTDGVDLKSRKKLGSEKTPNELIKYMLNIIGYDKNVSSWKSIIDPACGTGTFIKHILERFIDGLYNDDMTELVKEKLLINKLIRAYDIKPENVFITKIVMIFVLVKRKLISKMDDILEIFNELPVYCQDFLKVNEKADYIIGNPPYIRLQNMSVEYRDFVKKHYVSAKGRFDIFTCFIEKSDKLLNANGRLCLITSNKYLTANYGGGIRGYLSKTGHVKKLVDLCDTKFFGAAVLPSIIMCENNEISSQDVDYIGIKISKQKEQYCCYDENGLFDYIENKMTASKSNILCKSRGMTVFEVSRSKVRIPLGTETWNFSTSDELDIKDKMDERKVCSLADIFEVCVGIKTTADTVFVKPMTKKFIKEQKFEENTVYPLIQSFNVNKWNILWGDGSRDRYILYPHKEKDGNTVAIPLEDMPQAGRYLKENSNILKKRSYLIETKNRMWYECWVPQKLSKFKQIKIVTRDIVSSNSFALDIEGRLCQGNTFFLIKKTSNILFDFGELTEYQYYCLFLGILNSKAMEFYQKLISGCLYSKKYRYTTSNINRWPMPQIDVLDSVKIVDYVEKLMTGNRAQFEHEIDKIIYKAFGLTEHEIKKIEDFVE